MTDQDLERRLVAAFAVDPARGFQVADGRVAAIVARVAEPRRRLGQAPRVVLGLVAAFLLLTGAAVGAITVLDRIADGNPGTAVAWERGVDIGQRVLHGDYAVTLVRGYADINATVLGLSVERTGESGPGDVPGLELELRDPAGVVLGPGSPFWFGALEEGRRIDELVIFGPTTSSDGEYTLRLGLSGPDAGGGLPWAFRFELPAPAGAVVQVDQTQIVDGTSVAVSEVRLSPTTLNAAIHVSPDDPDASGWAAIGSFGDGTRKVNIDWGLGGSTDFDLTLGTYSGVDDAAGTWTLTIDEVVGGRDDGTQVRLQGPWTFTFEVPAP